MTAPGMFGGTDDLVPSARELAERDLRPAGRPERPAPHPDDAGSVLFADDGGLGSSLGPDEPPHRPASRRSSPAPGGDDGDLVPGAPPTQTAPPVPVASPSAETASQPQSDPWPTLPTGGTRSPFEHQVVARSASFVVPKPTTSPSGPVVTQAVEWRGTQALWAFGRAAVVPILGAAIFSRGASADGMSVIMIVCVALGVILGSLYLRVAIAARPSEIAVDPAGLEVRAGSQSFSLPWSQVQHVSVEERELRGRGHTTSTALLQVILTPGSDVLRRCRGAWIYRTTRPRTLEVPISTLVVDDLNNELNKIPLSDRFKT